MREERPWVVVSNDRHPFDHEECVVAAVTTTERDGAVSLDDADFTTGGVPRTSYVSPWFLATRKRAGLGELQGNLTDETFQKIYEETVRFLRPM